MQSPSSSSLHTSACLASQTIACTSTKREQWNWCPNLYRYRQMCCVMFSAAQHNYVCRLWYHLDPERQGIPLNHQLIQVQWLIAVKQAVIPIDVNTIKSVLIQKGKKFICKRLPVERTASDVVKYWLRVRVVVREGPTADTDKEQIRSGCLQFWKLIKQAGGGRNVHCHNIERWSLDICKRVVQMNKGICYALLVSSKMHF